MTIVAVRYDLRAPTWAATQHAELYRECLDQCAAADEAGVDMIVLSEHHGTADGYLPAPLSMAAAVAGRTRRIGINIAAALVPLHDPVRFAEQLLVADLASGGRVSVVLGAGYAPRDFEMAGVDRSRRGKLLDEAVEVMRRAWTGEPFTWDGREIQVTPAPVSRPHPPLFVGGSSVAAAKRAARLGLPFFPAVNDPALQQAYEQACADAGFAGGFCLLPVTSGYVFVSRDPDAFWAELEPYAWHDAETYRSWQTPDVRSEVASEAAREELRDEGLYRVLEPQAVVELAREMGPMGTVVLHPLLAGLPLELARSSFELFCSDVLPALRAA